MSNERIEFLNKKSSIHHNAHLLYISSAKYGEDWHSQLHSHHFTELFYVIKGKGGFIIENDEFEVKADDFIIINPNTMHTEVSLNKNPLEYIVIALDGLSFEIPNNSLKNYVNYNYQQHQDKVLNYLLLLVKESLVKEEHYEEMCQQLVQVLLLNILRLNNLQVTASEKKKMKKEAFIIKDYIDRYYHEDITLDVLASKLHMNKFYLAHEFKKDVGVSPISYLVQRRIHESKYLLKDTDLSVSQISDILGFSSLSYFAQTFKRSTSLSPLQYRKNHELYKEE